MCRIRTVVVVTCLFLGTICVAADQKAQQSAGAERAVSQQALEKFNRLIGGWRGAGQPKRGSNRGSWSEKGEWVWQLSKKDVAVRYNVSKGKLLKTALLTYDPQKKRYQLVATLPDGKKRTYTGALTKKKLILESSAGKDGKIHQFTVTMLNEKRTLVLYQSRSKKQTRFRRIAEVGYTRDGTRLAVEGADGPECIVTGGRGTSSVVYKGKTYYFCCTGCRDAFNDDPERILAEAKKRIDRRKKDRAKAAAAKKT